MRILEMLPRRLIKDQQVARILSKDGSWKRINDSWNWEYDDAQDVSRFLRFILANEDGLKGILVMGKNRDPMVKINPPPRGSSSSSSRGRNVEELIKEQGYGEVQSDWMIVHLNRTVAGGSGEKNRMDIPAKSLIQLGKHQYLRKATVIHQGFSTKTGHFCTTQDREREGYVLCDDEVETEWDPTQEDAREIDENWVLALYKKVEPKGRSKTQVKNMS